MKTMLGIFLVGFFLVTGVVTAQADETMWKRNFGASPELILPKLVTRDDGETAFEDVRLEMDVRTFMSRESTSLPADSVNIWEMQGGIRLYYHPAPANQILFILQGTLVIEASTGEVREFPSGSWVWVTDSKAPTKGHKSWAKDETDIVAAVVRIDEEALPK